MEGEETKHTPLTVVSQTPAGWPCPWVWRSRRPVCG